MPVVHISHGVKASYLDWKKNVKGIKTKEQDARHSLVRRSFSEDQKKLANECVCSDVNKQLLRTYKGV